MVALPKQTRRYTPEEYFEREREAEFKHEYLDGIIYEWNGGPENMAGGSPNHSLIAANTTIALGTALDDKPCRVYTSDQLVASGKEGFYGYPDVTVVCGEPRYRETQKNVLTNPLAIVEVLSPSTEKLDRGERWERYQTTDSLQVYILIAQDKPRVELYQRQQDGSWRMDVAMNVQTQLPIQALDCKLSLARVYKNIAFSTEDDA